MNNEGIEQYREFTRRLQQEQQKLNVLNDIKNFFTFKPAEEAINILKEIGISKVALCLTPENKSFLGPACDVLKICFDKFKPGDTVKYYTGHIMYMLRHDEECVRLLAMEQVYKAVTSDPAILPVPQYIDVYVAVAQLTCDPNLSVANKAILITSNLPFEAYPKILEEMKVALEHNNSIKCNAYEVISNIASKSFELCQLSADLGYLDHMMSGLSSSDMLYQLNILELLSRIATKPHGINHLIKNGALQLITQQIIELDDNPLGPLLKPGYIKFFGNIAHQYPKEIFDKYPAVLNSLFESFESGDPSLLPVALDTLGYIGMTIEGKLCLAALGSKYILAVEQVGNFIKTSGTETKVRAIYCLANLVCVDKDPNTPKKGPIDHRVTLMTREWFRSLSQRPTAIETLFGILKIPFTDIRLAAFSLLDAICQHRWGEELVAREAGFIEYLLDRSIDLTKEEKEAKYDIIRRLSRSPAFEEHVTVRLQTYIDQGPFYSESGMAVAMDEGE